MKNQILVAAVAVVLVVVIASSFTDLVDFFTPKSGIEISSSNETQQSPPRISEAGLGKISLNAPAVDDNGNGVTTKLTVEAIPGKGRILTNIDQLLFWVDTQYSIQTAKYVAENVTKINTSDIDLIYTIETEASLIEGPSAGAAMTTATIALLENRTLNPTVAITGTINPDGSIGPVGGIPAKANASEIAGAKIFLVPEGQGLQTNYVPETTCKQIGNLQYCTTQYTAQKVNVTSESGIQIIEVRNIQEALKYLLV